MGSDPQQRALESLAKKAGLSMAQLKTKIRAEGRARAGAALLAASRKSSAPKAKARGWAAK